MVVDSDIISNLKSFWIINNTGLCLYSYIQSGQSEEIDIDNDMFSGMISALMSFTEMMTFRNINKIFLGDVSFYIETHNGLIITALLNTKVNEDVIKSILSDILYKFHISFEDKINTIQTDWSEVQAQFQIILQNNILTESNFVELVRDVGHMYVDQFLNKRIGGDYFFESIHDISLLVPHNKRDNFLREILRHSEETKTRNGSELSNNTDLEKVKSVIISLQDYDIINTIDTDAALNMFNLYLLYKSNYYKSGAENV